MDVLVRIVAHGHHQCWDCSTAIVDVAASVTNPELTHDVNASGTLNVLRAAANNGVKKFVFASSTAVYGDTETLPAKEDTALRPLSPYAASKAAGEAYCNAFAVCYGINTVVLRFFNAYGPRNENSPYSGVITEFLKKALNDEPLRVEGDGKQTRDFIHVNDVTDALVQALENDGLKADVFNVCTGVPTSINGLADALREVTGRDLRITHAPPRAGDIRFIYGDPSKAAEKLKFKSKTSLQQGLRLLLESAAT
jgi:UDP-glucose 4-epimerase